MAYQGTKSNGIDVVKLVLLHWLLFKNLQLLLFLMLF